MNISIKTRNFDITPALTEYTEKKLDVIHKLISERFNQSVIVDVELGRAGNHQHSGEIFRAEATVLVKGRSYRAVSEKENIYTAIDDVRDELMRELRTEKRKRLHSLRAGGRKFKNMIRNIFRKDDEQAIEE
jgi:putative sigma-54 modulation protein